MDIFSDMILFISHVQHIHKLKKNFLKMSKGNSEIKKNYLNWSLKLKVTHVVFDVAHIYYYIQDDQLKRIKMY